MRRRRSAQLTPALVERMDVAEDAVGRVAIFTVDDTPAPLGAGAPRRGGSLPAGIGTILDARYTVIVIVNVLVVVLVFGLWLLRR